MQRSAIASRGAAPAAIVVRPVSSTDLPAIMAIERMPGFEGHVGRSEEAEHRAMLASPAYAYRLGVGAGVEAFAILSGLGDPHRNLYLKRVAVSRPGEGLGTAFLGLVLDEAFGRLGAERMSLDCFLGNARAQRSPRPLTPIGSESEQASRPSRSSAGSAIRTAISISSAWLSRVLARVWDCLSRPRPRRGVRTARRRALEPRLLPGQRPRATRLREARLHPGRRAAKGLPPAGRDAAGPPPDGAPEERVGGAIGRPRRRQRAPAGARNLAPIAFSSFLSPFLAFL